ncbi:hypothetical protein [Actinoplanes sp. N902-109]|uniref:hypothetical protein n=1 Tax=Actinoplanes sp. (strain N902-109) TaxID=649831 RepID=UPI0003295A41|nr:hypothetical protein [Actinoplanes sp. N902-109]AGL17802.1 hypothetical protein L083_4292 [Actinoplanes sp. N902-109]
MTARRVIFAGAAIVIGVIMLVQQRALARGTIESGRRQGFAPGSPRFAWSFNRVLIVGTGIVCVVAGSVALATA